MAKRPGAKPPKVGPPKRGEVYLVNFDPTIGSEIKKTRPALVLQNDVSNRYSPITIVAAITSKFDEGQLYPTEILIPTPQGGLSLDSVVLLNQIRSIDRARLVKRLGRVNPETMRKVNQALSISLGLIDL
jgi:mRNA interferase MazF